MESATCGRTARLGQLLIIARPGTKRVNNTPDTARNALCWPDATATATATVTTRHATSIRSKPATVVRERSVMRRWLRRLLARALMDSWRSGLTRCRDRNALWTRMRAPTAQVQDRAHEDSGGLSRSQWNGHRCIGRALVHRAVSRAEEEAECVREAAGEVAPVPRVFHDEGGVHGSEPHPVAEDLVPELVAGAPVAVVHDGGGLEGDRIAGEEDLDERRKILAPPCRRSRPQGGVEPTEPLQGADPKGHIVAGGAEIAGGVREQRIVRAGPCAGVRRGLERPMES